MWLVHHAEQDIWITGTEGTLRTEAPKESDRRDGPNDLCTRLLVLMISGDYLLLSAISQHHNKLIIVLVVQHKEQNCRCTGSMKSIFSTAPKQSSTSVWYDIFFFHCNTHKDTCLSLFLLSLSGSSLSAIRPSSSCCSGVWVPIIFCSSQSILRICLQKAGDALKSVSEPAYLIWRKTEDKLLKSSLLQKLSFYTCLCFHKTTFSCTYCEQKKPIEQAIFGLTHFLLRLSIISQRI